MSNASKNFDILATGLSVLYNHFENYFSDLYSAKILDLSAKSFFPCRDSLRILMLLITSYVKPVMK